MRRSEKKIFWCITAFGLALPWMIGIGVKLYLQFQGRPTWPFEFFFQPHIFVMSLICTVWFATPYIGLALFARFILSKRSFFRTSYLERLIIILGGFLCGSVTAVKIFLEVFLVFDPMIFLAFSLPSSYVIYMLIGLLGGSLVAAMMVLFRKRPPLLPKSDLIQNLNEQEVGAFTGKKADYYIKKWRPTLEGRGQWAGFNWAAFFLTGVWFAYRKMYKATFVYYGARIGGGIFLGAVLAKHVESNFLEILFDLVAGIVCGTFGNIWYLSRAQRAIEGIRSRGLQEEAVSQTLSKLGGTNIGLSIGLCILFIGVEVLNHLFK